jgi:hypothetical protein
MIKKFTIILVFPFYNLKVIMCQLIFWLKIVKRTIFEFRSWSVGYNLLVCTSNMQIFQEYIQKWSLEKSNIKV